MGIPEKIRAIEDEMARTQVNKATEHHLGLLKAKIAKLRREQEDAAVKKSGARHDGFDVRRSGDATVVFIGLPSVGKSTLLNRLTGANSEVGSYQFTTLTVVPGMMEYRGARIQMLDLPGIIKGASSGRGLGKRILSVARSADLVLLVLDVFQPHHARLLASELGNIGIRLNLLPIPLLDGGHLLYYAVEFVRGRPVSEASRFLGQRLGIALLVGLMGLALYNDLARLLG